VLLLFSFNLNALTLDENRKTVTLLGSSSNNGGHVGFAEPVDKNCAWGVLYFDVSTPAGKSFLAIFIVAKTTGQKVRVVYTPPSSVGACNLDLAALQ